MKIAYLVQDYFSPAGGDALTKQGSLLIAGAFSPSMHFPPRNICLDSTMLNLLRESQQDCTEVHTELIDH